MMTTIWLDKSQGYETQPDCHSDIGGKNAPQPDATSSCPTTLKMKRKSSSQSTSANRGKRV